MEIRRSYDRLIFTMGFPILVRWHLYIEQAGKLKFFGTRPNWAVFYTTYTKFHLPRPVLHSPGHIFTRIDEQPSASFPAWLNLGPHGQDLGCHVVSLSPNELIVVTMWHVVQKNFIQHEMECNHFLTRTCIWPFCLSRQLYLQGHQWITPRQVNVMPTPKLKDHWMWCQLHNPKTSECDANSKTQRSLNVMPTLQLEDPANVMPTWRPVNVVPTLLQLQDLWRLYNMQIWSDDRNVNSLFVSIICSPW